MARRPAWVYWLAEQYEALWWAAGALAFFGLGVTLLAHLRPLYVSVTKPVAYRIQGTFSYTASVPDRVFPTGELPTGAPLYLDLTPLVDLRFVATFQAPFPHAVQGRGWLWAEVEDAYGWRRRVMHEEDTFSGDVWDLQGVLPLRTVENLIRDRERFLPVGRDYGIRVGLTLIWSGDLQGHPWRREVSAQWRFRRMEEGFYVLTLKASGDTDPLRPSWDGVVETTERRLNHITLGPWFLSVLLLRRLGWGFLGVGVLALIGLQGWLSWVYQREPEAYYLAYLGRQCLRLEPGPWMWSRDVYVPLRSLSDMSRLAQQFQEPILYVPQGEEHHFFLWLPDVVYTVTLPRPSAREETSSEAVGPEEAGLSPSANPDREE